MLLTRIPTLGAAVFDRAGGVGPLRPAQRSPAQDVTDYAQQMLVCLRRGCRTGTVVVADGGYAKREFLRHCQSMSKPIVVVTKLRKDASRSLRRNCGPAKGGPGWSARVCPVPRRAGRSRYTVVPTALPVPTAGRPGRARFGRGAVVPREAAAPSHTLGRHQIPGGAPRALCFAMHRHRAEPLRILQWYLLRWQVEVTFEELRAHLAWKPSASAERAIARTTPALFGLFSGVTLAADILIEQRGAMAPRTAAWYDKTSPSFADAIALVRRHLWVHQGTFMPSEREHESIKVPCLLYHRMLDTLAWLDCTKPRYREWIPKLT